MEQENLGEKKVVETIKTYAVSINGWAAIVILFVITSLFSLIKVGIGGSLFCFDFYIEGSKGYILLALFLIGCGEVVVMLNKYLYRLIKWIKEI